MGNMGALGDWQGTGKRQVRDIDVPDLCLFKKQLGTKRMGLKLILFKGSS
jgi:hypothetical protein